MREEAGYRDQAALAITEPVPTVGDSWFCFARQWRRVGARTHEALQEAIGQALETVTAADAP